MATNISVSPSIQSTGRTQETTGERISVRRDGAGSGSGGFSPRTNVSIANSIDNMSAILSKLSSDRADAENAVPSQLKDIISNIMRNSFSLNSSLSEGVGSSLASQRFSVEQLTNLSRMLQQLGGIAEQSQMEDLGDDLLLLFKNISSTMTEHSSLEPVMLNKLAFQIINSQSTEVLPKDLQQLLAQLSVLSGLDSGSGTVAQLIPEQDNTFGFLKQLVDAFFPKSSTAAQQQASSFSQAPQQAAGNGQSPVPQPSVEPGAILYGSSPSQEGNNGTPSSLNMPGHPLRQNAFGSALVVGGNTMPEAPALTQQANSAAYQANTNSSVVVPSGAQQAQGPQMMSQEIPVLQMGQAEVGTSSAPTSIASPAQNMLNGGKQSGQVASQNSGQTNEVISNNTQPSTVADSFSANIQKPALASNQSQQPMVEPGQGTANATPQSQTAQQAPAQGAQNPQPHTVQQALAQGTHNTQSQTAQTGGVQIVTDTGELGVMQSNGQGTATPASQTANGVSAATQQSQTSPQANVASEQAAQQTQPGQTSNLDSIANSKGQSAVQTPLAENTLAEQKTVRQMSLSNNNIDNTLTSNNAAVKEPNMADMPVRRGFNPSAANYDANSFAANPKTEMNPLFKQIFNRFGNQPAMHTVASTVAEPKAPAFNVEGNPQIANAMKDTAQLLIKNAELSPKDAQLLKDFVNNTQGSLPQEDARQLNILLRTVQGNIPAAVQQAGQQAGLDGLPRLYAFMQLSQLATIRTMRSRGYKQASRHVDTFVSSVKGSMVNDGTYKADGQKSISFMMPIYLGENEQSYPAYVNIYDEPPHEDERGVMQKDTWFRVCVLTDSIGAVDVVCRLYEGKNLNLRIVFSDQDVVKEFTEYLPEIRKALYDTPINLTDLRVGTVN